jgi:hypothetical protein
MAKKKKVNIKKYPRHRMSVKENIVEQARLTVRNVELLREIKRLESEIGSYQKRNVQIIEIDLGDPTPVGKEERKLYTAQVAGIFREILEPKLKQMISSAFLLMENESNSHEMDLQIKGTIYALREMMRWGDKMVNETVADQAGDSPSAP